MIDVSLQTYLSTLTSYPVQQDTIASGDTENRVWFQRQTANTDLFLTTGATGLTTTTFAVEVMGLDIDDVQDKANTIKAALNGFAGTMGSDAVLLGIVEDAGDDYAAKNMGADEGIHIASFQCKLIQA